MDEQEEIIEEIKEEIINAMDESPELLEEQTQLEEIVETIKTETSSSKNIDDKKQTVPKPQEIEATLNQGLQFLNGIFKMATGKELIADGKGITVNRETGEVTMKFKLPGF